MERDKAIFFGVVGAVLILLIVYISLSFGKDKSKDQKEESFETPDLDIENKKYDYNSRIAALTNDRYEDVQRENTLRYNFIEEKEETPEEEIKEEPEEKPVITEKKKPTSKRKTTSVKRTPTTSNNTKTLPRQKESEKDNTVSVSYSFSSGSSDQATDENTKAVNNHKMIWAQLNDKISVKHGSYQVFLLEKGSNIGGRYFPGNSKLYTMAVTEAQYIDIQVYRIKDINTGEEFSVSMYAINEDRGRGIKYQGKANKEGDKARNNLISETMRSVSRRYDVDEVGEAIGEGVEDISSRDKIEVPLAKGYRLIFVEN